MTHSRLTNFSTSSHTFVSLCFQRTEVEQFFLDSLEYVKNEIVRNRYSYMYMQALSWTKCVTLDLTFHFLLAAFILEKNLGVFLVRVVMRPSVKTPQNGFCVNTNYLFQFLERRSKRQTWLK